MKIMLIFLSILIILAGILPVFGQDGLDILPPYIPTEAPGYSLIIATMGLIAMIYGVMNRMLIGIEKFIVLVIGLITILGGLLPYIQFFIPINLPTSGPIYSGIIILIGIITFIYGRSRIS